MTNDNFVAAVYRAGRFDACVEIGSFGCRREQLRASIARAISLACDQADARGDLVEFYTFAIYDHTGRRVESGRVPASTSRGLDTTR